MAIITFWSNTHKQTGQSMSLIAAATSMAIEHNYKILIMSTQYNDDTLELCFGGTDKNKKLLNKLVGNSNIAVDNGIEGLSKVANSGRLTPDLIPNYTHVVYKNRLEILYSYKEVEDRPTKEEYLKAKEKYKDIIQNANNIYDMVFVDLDKGLNDEMVRQILNISDVVVYNVEQKISMINDFIKLKNDTAKEKKDNLLLNIGRFDSHSKYTVKNISRYVGLRRDITVIPYNTLYNEAANEENVADLFLKIRKVSGEDRNAKFVKEVQETSEKIIYKLQELQMKMR